MNAKYVSFYKVAVEEDMSEWILRAWIDEGYRELEWQYAYEEWKDTKKWREQGSVCPTCFALDGQRFKIQDVLDKTTHNAPKYSMAHVGCYCRMKRIAREDERLDYPVEQKQAPVEKTPEQRLEDIGYTVIHIEEAVRDLFERQSKKEGSEYSYNDQDVQNVKDQVVEYSKELSMTNKSVARDELWRRIQKLVWAITKERTASASYFGFIRVARQVKKELEETLIW